MPTQKPNMAPTYLSPSKTSRFSIKPLLTIFIMACFLTSVSSLKVETQVDVPFTKCQNQTTTDYQNTKVYFDDASNVAPGKTLTITLQGSINSDTSMIWKRFDIYQGTIKIQEDQIQVDPAQSYSKGTAYSVNYVYKFPDVIPPGEYTGQVQFIGADKTVRGCWEFNLVFNSSF